MHQMVPINFLPIFISMLSQQNISQKGSWQDTKTRSSPLPPPPPSPNHTLCFSSAVGPAFLALARLQVDRVLAAPLPILWLLPLHAFLLPLILSCFSFTCFLRLWLCFFSSSFVSCHYGFVLFLHVFPTAVALHDFTFLYFCKIRIHPYPLIQGHYGLSTIY